VKILTGTFCIFLIVCPTMAILPLAWAALGQPAASIERDRVVMKGQQRQSQPGTNYSVQTITVAGMLIKEYVSPDGVVFAVAWKGTGVPDLQLLLGEYFEEYREGLTAERQRTPRIRKPLKLKTGRLVVERGGHSRSLWGRAYLPEGLPPGVTPEDIQ
jgi:hypothetical protein